MATWTLTTLREYVRAHLDLDDQDLTSTMLDAWANEASERITAKRQHWPFREAEWTFNTSNGVSAYDISSIGSGNIDEIGALVIDGDRVLEWVGPTLADTMHVSSSSSNPTYWTVRAAAIRLYPTPNAAETVRVVGWRKASDWVGSQGTPDFPTEFHNVIRNWMLGSAYLQQEDTELGITHLDMAEDELNKLARKYGDMPDAAPLVISGRGGVTPLGRLRYPWE